MNIRPTQILFSPLTVIFVSYIAVFFFQLEVVFPAEEKLFPIYAKTASLMFLPHAVRVLATAIIGPKAFFLLLPAMVIAEFVNGVSFGEAFDGTSILITLVGAGCAPAGYMLLKTVLKDRLDFSRAMLNWRYVFVIGVIASAINSVGLVAVFVLPAEASEILMLMLLFFIGDILGLFVGLVVLTFVFRFLRGRKAA